MRTEQSKKSKFADLDAALLNLKHSIKANVPDGEMLTEIGLNVLKRAQAVRDSLVKTMFQAKKPARTVKVAAQYSGAKAAPKVAAKSKVSAKSKTTKGKAKTTGKKKTSKK